MRNISKISKRILALLLVLTSQCCPSASVAAEPTNSDEGLPALRVISANGQQNILIGTMHVGHERLIQADPERVQGFRRLVFEHGYVPPRSKDAPHKDGGLSSWTQSLRPEDLTLLRDRARCLVSPENFEKALHSQSAYGMSVFASYRCPPVFRPSLETTFAWSAYRRHLPIDFLEPPEEIAAARDAVPERLYEIALHKALGVNVDEVYDQIAIALNKGNYDAIMSLLELSFDAKEDLALYNEIKIFQRNRRWVPRLQSILDEGGAVVIVGASHLPGDEGLIMLLRKAGNQVEQIYLPSDGFQAIAKY